jgi:hypothetical protein
MLPLTRQVLADSRALEAAHPSQPNRLKEFAFGLIYDSLGWTPGDEPTDQQMEAVLQAIELAIKEEVLEEDLREIRQILIHENMYVSPPLPDEEV